MQHALKLALVDPRHVAYKNILKSPEVQVRADSGLHMSDILSDKSIPDDLKLKLYNQSLNRLMKTGDSATDQSSSINWTASVPAAAAAAAAPYQPVPSSAITDLASVPINYTATEWRPSDSEKLHLSAVKKRKLSKAGRSSPAVTRSSKRQPKQKSYDFTKWMEY